MMSDSLDGETLIGLRAAAELFPAIDGRRPSAVTIWRYATKGLHGVRLEHRRIARRIVTSREAIARFLGRVAEVQARTTTRSTNPTREPQAPKIVDPEAAAILEELMNHERAN